MSVCIIGNSHLAALKMGLALPEAKAINPRTIQFWGARGHVFSQAELRDGRLEVPDAFLRPFVTVSHGVKAVDPRAYQAVVLHGVGLDFPGAILEVARLGRPSAAFLTQAVDDFLFGSRAFAIVKAFREIANIPYVLSLQPCGSDSVLRDKDQQSIVPASLRKDMLQLLDRAVGREGFKLLHQPVSTLSDQVNYTRAAYSAGSTRLDSSSRHPVTDTVHMNGDYGLQVLKSLLSSLKLKLIPDAAEPPPPVPITAAAIVPEATPIAPTRPGKPPAQPAPGTLPVHQISNRTWHDRHPAHIDAVRSATGASRPRVLSFGCASGEECNDIAKRWPDAIIFGTDLREGLIAKGRARYGSDRVQFFLSTPENLAEHGPFDAVFAMNVLCRHPECQMKDDIADIYPFSAFQSGVEVLDSVLSPGGTLCLFNTNYFFQDTSVADKYTQIEGVDDIGMIERCNPDGQRSTDLFVTWNGVTYDRLTWAELDKSTAVREDVSYHHEWRAAFDGQGRSLSGVIWRKLA